MAWYRIGTISLVAGSKNVVGDGTAFIKNVATGFALLAPDLRLYEIDVVSSDTALTIKEEYAGATASDQAYAIIQTQGTIADLAAQISELLSTFGPMRDSWEDVIAAGEATLENANAAAAAKTAAETAASNSAAAESAAVAAAETATTKENQASVSAGVATTKASEAAASAQSAADLAMVFSRANAFINGEIRIDQRNAGAAQTFTAGAALAYCVDRWYGYCAGANVTGQQVAGSGNVSNRYRFTGAAGVTGIGFGQRIAALNSAHLAGTTATFSVDLANSLLAAVTWTAYYANTSDVFGSLASPTRTQIATGTFAVNAAITRYAAQIAMPAAATTGIEIVLSVGAQTSGTWTIGNLKVEAGSVATPFSPRTYEESELQCLRYYEKSFPRTVAPANGASATAFASVNTTVAIAPHRTSMAGGAYIGRCIVPFKVRKRGAPAMTVYGNSAAQLYNVSASAWVSAVAAVANENGFEWTNEFASGPSTIVEGHWAASAEL